MGNLLSSCFKKDKEEEEEEPQAPEDSGPQLMSQDDPAKIKLNKSTQTEFATSCSNCANQRFEKEPKSVFLAFNVFNFEQARKQEEMKQGMNLQSRRRVAVKTIDYSGLPNLKEMCQKPCKGRMT